MAVSRRFPSDGERDARQHTLECMTYSDVGAVFLSSLQQVSMERTNDLMMEFLRVERAKRCIYAAFAAAAARLAFTSATAERIASSASMEQCNFTGGKFKCFAIS